MIFTNEITRQEQMTLQLAYINHLEQNYQILQDIETKNEREKIAIGDAIDLIGVNIEAECYDFVDTYNREVEFIEKKNEWVLA